MKPTLLTITIASGLVAIAGAVLIAQDTAAVRTSPPQTWESCEEMHDTYVARFEAAPGFGLSRMSRPPMLERSGVLELGRARYTIEQHELVGLLKVNPPAVYVPDWHGATPVGFKSRELTDFEKQSVAAFKAGKDLASAAGEENGTMRCIGSLRAKASCLSCHRDKKTGDLLGAFTYKLRALPPRAQ
jgi:hypothetical protein